MGKQEQQTDSLEGTFCSNARGFGFVTVAGEEQDYFIAADDVGGAFHGDTVVIAVLPESSGRRREARIIRVIQREIKTVVGEYSKGKNHGFVTPDNRKINTDIMILQGKDLHAVSGHKVLCRITDYGDRKRKPEGEITEILGHCNDPGVEVLSVIKGYELPMEFPQRVLSQAQRAAKDVSEADMQGRMDLREVPMVTIDGEDAKDLDDAVSVSREGSHYVLGVHIADVTNYVQENSALDREALKRGTSVYLADRVIPMLPHVLSNGICSLNRGEDRLALSCIMTVDENGKVIDHTIAESVVRVDRRMSYTDVKKILGGQDSERMEQYRDFVSMFQLMEELSRIIRRRRMQRGSIDFDFPETKIIMDKRGRVVDLRPYDRNVATKMIEDFMLLANETVAQHFYWQELPFVYRIHGTPEGEKIRKLAAFIGNFGFTIKGSSADIHPKELQKLLGRIEGSPQEDLISRLVLRSMQQAKYSQECSGHFGLAAEYYCHFTSPIRRYPDLQIHRIIKESLRGRLNAQRIEHYASILPRVADTSSKMERRAQEAEREVDKLKKVEYMQQHIGEEFCGVISGVTGWGLYVELPNTVEGLVHVNSLRDDFYRFVEESYELVGENNNRHFKLGQPIRVVACATDPVARTIDFVLAEDGDE